MDIESPQFKRMLEITEKVKDIAKGSNTFTAPLLLRDFVTGMDIAGDLLSMAIKEDVEAHARLKHAEAMAYFDRASDYLKLKGVRDSSEAKKTYIPLDPDVMVAADNKAKTEAMVALLKNKLTVLRCAHDDVKKMSYTNDNVNNPV